ncbi:MAG: type IV pilus biogenesis/stability protein PilW [Thiotrichaceae bacterium]|nr:type IV pilus biogenesis/stability protein PilW [Thiotrichaceae bacterium]
MRKTLLFFVALTFSLATTGCTPTNTANKPESASRFNALLGAEYLKKGRLKLAHEKLSKAIEQNPRSANAHHYFAVLQQTLKQTELANQHFLTAIHLEPKNPEINNNYGSFLCKQKKYPQAEKHFDVAIKDPLYSTPYFALTNAGICAHDAGQLVKADNFLRSALKKQSNFAPALYALAKLAYDQHNFSHSQAFLFRYNEVAGNNAKTLNLCRLTSTQLGNTSQAEQCASKLLQQYPNSPEAISIN